jgi:predicted enzyme related to lactoylglutathione lyase
MNQPFIVRSDQNGSVDDRWISRPARIDGYMSTNQPAPRPVVHLELHTADLARASAFYSEVLQWEPELIRAASSSYLALDLGSSLGGGIVECGTQRSLWLPYVEVDLIYDATERAHRLGAAVLLEPREGPSGWRSVVSSAEAGEVALWEPKR